MMPRMTQFRPVSDPAAARRKARIIAALTAVCRELGAAQNTVRARQDYREVLQFLDEERVRLAGESANTGKLHGRRNGHAAPKPEGKHG